MSTDPQIRIVKLVEQCRAAGSSSLYIDKPFYDAVCRSYAHDPRRTKALSLKGFIIKAHEIQAPVKADTVNAQSAANMQAQMNAAMQSASMFGMGGFRF